MGYQESIPEATGWATGRFRVLVGTMLQISNENAKEGGMMEAKDTVMHLCNHPYHNKECHKDQAELSFRAGYEKGLETNGAISHLDIYNDGKLAGIREVVEWVEGEEQPINRTEWQAKLKEWGL